jgi:hypothetical protein
MNPPDPIWRDQFVRARDLRALGRHSELVAQVRRGELVPVIRGVYRRASAVTRDTVRMPDDVFLARVRAAQLISGERLIYVAFAAAVVWDLPIVGTWPERVTVLAPPSGGGRSNATLARTSVGYPVAAIVRDGLLVTSLARTVVDVGRSGTFGQAVAMADAALHGQVASAGHPGRRAVTLAALRAEATALGVVPGSARCQGVLQFANGASESAGESVSRVAIHSLGLPAPQLQVAFADARGNIGVVDFYWPELGLVGEFDGFGKYVRDEFTGGRSLGEIIMAEKERENRLRALGLTVVRWDWAVALSLPKLRSRLADAGLR